MSRHTAEKVGEIFKVTKDPTDWVAIISGIVFVAFLVWLFF